MYRVNKEYKFSSAHRLSKHAKRCKYIHGHNYRVQVQLESMELDNNDMVIDFSLLKEIMDSVLDKYDHALILNSNDKELFNSIDSKYTERHVIFEGTDPTAESMSEKFFWDIIQELKNRDLNHITLDVVKVWETDSAYAEFVKSRY